MVNSIIVRYGEIFLKSENVFRIYENKLLKNIERKLKEKNVSYKIARERGRIFLFFENEENLRKSLEALKFVFGIVSYSPAYFLETVDENEIKDFLEKIYPNLIPEGKTFAIRVKRSIETEKNSKELENFFGKFINRKVNLENPDVEIGIEIRKIGSFLFTQKIEGLKGLPISTSGKVISLISGGIDSPVASFFAMKRGCEVIFLHFSSFPIASKASVYKVEEILRILKEYQGRTKLYIAYIGEEQLKMKNKVEPRFLVVLYRRLFYRVAEKVAKKENAKAIVTGESLGQVSSQTLQNLMVEEEAIKLPVLRPLIGMDKEEIVEIAKKLKTYEISIRPCEDTCSLFVPK
ncbi:MAG: tRNA uracil 4-sulfurtransferase ThiI, partial [Candidatus Aenigmatarchaeota archaeon]